MIPKDCKRLAEVDFPIAVVSKHAAKEKSIRHGHPSTLHLWWARRPLASSRAVLLALLFPDPGDPLCPDGFKAEARWRLPGLGYGKGETDEDLRRELLRFIGDFADWKLSSHASYLEVSRALVRAAHPDEPPLVVDPFAGGGSIPLEALRVGCDAFASDLNPVACLILKVMLEDIPRHGPELAEELRRVGAEIKQAAERELADLYPKDPDGATPIAYLWARTVRCESPRCGAEIPLVRSFWLSKKAHRRRALRWHVERPSDGPPRVEFEVVTPATEAEVQRGTVSRAKATCCCCGTVLPPERVRAQLAAERGGADTVFDEAGHRVGGARLLAVVTLRPGETGRHYRLPTAADYAAVRLAQQRLEMLLDDWRSGGEQGLCPVPDEPSPRGGGVGAGRAFSVLRYGMNTWGDLFSRRQSALLATIRQLISRDGKVVAELSIALNRVAERFTSLARWDSSPKMESVAGTFSRAALPVVWDFAEQNPLMQVGGNWQGALDWISAICERRGAANIGQVEPANATKHPLPDESASVWFTDPPYYDAVPYADLSDFFLVWLKRALPDHPLLKDPFDPTNPLSPKLHEAVQDETKQVDGRPKDAAWFEETMARAFAEGRRVLREDGIGSVVFAHKTTEGWEALLSGMIRGGWTITGSWPIATEMGTRLRARDSAALATSVHLICRPRPEDAGIGDWGEVLRELPRRVRAWMQRLQAEQVRGADLVFACIGPALEVFSRYASVETPEGRVVGLPEYLEKVWEVVGRAALEQVLGDETGGALEEDARLTALFLWTLQDTPAASNGKPAADEAEADLGDADDDADDESPKRRKKAGFSLVFDVVRRFAQPLGIHLPAWEGRIIEIEKGTVRLLPIAERAKQLFGQQGAQAAAARAEPAAEQPLQLDLFPDLDTLPAPKRRGRRKATGDWDDTELKRPEATTLDKVHAAMLLQRAGKAHALRELLRAEVDRGPAFLRLANALSALYPRDSAEKRLLDAMLLAVPR